MTCYTALITPFDSQGKIDEEGFVRNLKRQTDVDGVVVLGTTGEAPTLTTQEKRSLIHLARTSSLHLMVGCGATSTEQTRENLCEAADLGADSALVITPHYNKPTQEGLFHHYRSLAEHSPLPLILYNNPGRTAINLHPETVRRLLEFPQITAIKEAAGNLAQLIDLMALKLDYPQFKVYAGDDIWTLPLMALGGDGVISTASNLVPRLMKQLVEEARRGDFAAARRINQHLMPLFKASGLETNPIPIKAAMEKAGHAAGSPRLPLTPLHARHRDVLHAALEGLL